MINLTVLAVGLALPCTLIVVSSLYSKAKIGESYTLDLGQLSRYYITALICWSYILK